MEQETIDRLLDGLVAYIGQTEGSSINPWELAPYYRSLEPVERLRLMKEYTEHVKESYPDAAFEDIYVALETCIDDMEHRRRDELIKGAIARIMTDSGPDLAEEKTRKMVDDYISRHFR